MANVRYMGGGSSATLGTKDITENGTYNAVNDDLDGYSSVTVEVPQPEGTKELSYNTNGIYTDIDVKDYAEAQVTVNVPQPSEQNKTITAQANQIVVTPDSGYLLNRVTINPQQNSRTYIPDPNTAQNDMGAVNSYRYVNTEGLLRPTGTKSVSYDSNGNYTEAVSTYENIDIEIDVPVSGTLGSKSIIANGTYTALDDDLDGYSSVNVNVPQNATLGIKSVTSNGDYYATSDGYDGYSRVNVNVAGGTLQNNKTVTATTSQQVVQPDSGYDGLEQVTVNPQVHTQTYTPAANTAANDMGAQNDYRYVNTSGMVVPGSVTPSNSSPAALTSGSAVTPSANGYAIASYNSVTPSNSSPVTLTSGDIVKLGGNGKAVASVTDVTPSMYPEEVLYNNIYKMNGSGYVVDYDPTPSDITPSNSNPAYFVIGEILSPTTSGYAIQSYSSKTPSDSSPASVSANSIIKPSSAGYLYATNAPVLMGVAPSKVETYTNVSNGTSKTITVTSKPRLITFFFTYYSATKGGMFLCYDTVNNKAYRYGYWNSAFHNEDFTSNVSGYITSVSSSSVVIKNNYGSAGNIAVGIYY